MNSNYPLAAYGFENAAGIASFVVGLILLLVLDAALLRFVKKTWSWIIIGGLEILFTVAAGFGLLYVMLGCIVALITYLVILVIINQTEIRTFIESPDRIKNFMESLTHKKKGVEPEYIFDREKVYQEVYKAVVHMSQVKRGALITFVKKDDILDDAKIGTIIKQRGVELNSPVKAELLETIFYEGTRLHDGAVVIKGDKIARAAVFFQSTNQALTGKYGSRHQAAIGISENSDSVTIVVSEETGRIAIAFQGELISVNPDTFMRVFEDYMAFVPESSEEEEETK